MSGYLAEPAANILESIGDLNLTVIHKWAFQRGERDLTCGVGHRDTVAADRCGLIEYHQVNRRRSGHVVPPCVGNIANDDTGAIKPHRHIRVIPFAERNTADRKRSAAANRNAPGISAGHQRGLVGYGGKVSRV